MSTTTKQDRPSALEDFARRALVIMQHSPEWDTDTLDAIAGAAYELKLARATPSGMFRATPDGPRRPRRRR